MLLTETIFNPFGNVAHLEYWQWPVGLLLERQVVHFAAAGVRKSLVSLFQLAELLGIAGCGVIRVYTDGQKLEDALDGLQLRAGADLQNLVIVDEVRVRRHGLPSGTRRSAFRTGEQERCISLRSFLT